MENDQLSCTFTLPLKTVTIWSLIYSKGILNQGEGNMDFTLKAHPDTIDYNDSIEDKD